MDNLENYLYLIFAVIYIVSRIIKSRAKQKEAQTQEQSQQTQPPVGQTQTAPKKQFSFEDILKEIERNMAGEATVEEKPEPVVERRIEAPRPKHVPKVERKQNVYETYEGVTYESQIAAGKDELETSLFARNDKYEIGQNKASEYAKMLQEPDGFRNAFVLSEIISRKYF